MNKDKKFKVQQDIITKLEQDVARLEAENTMLKAELEKPKEGYELAKKLTISLEQKKEEYQRLIEELHTLKASYLERMNKIASLEEKYQCALNDSLKEAKKALKQKGLFR